LQESWGRFSKKEKIKGLMGRKKGGTFLNLGGRGERGKNSLSNRPHYAGTKRVKKKKGGKTFDVSQPDELERKAGQ